MTWLNVIAGFKIGVRAGVPGAGVRGQVRRGGEGRSPGVQLTHHAQRLRRAPRHRPAGILRVRLVLLRRLYLVEVPVARMEQAVLVQLVPGTLLPPGPGGVLVAEEIVVLALGEREIRILGELGLVPGLDLVALAELMRRAVVVRSGAATGALQDRALGLGLAEVPDRHRDVGHPVSAAASRRWLPSLILGGWSS